MVHRRITRAFLELLPLAGVVATDPVFAPSRKNDKPGRAISEQHALARVTVVCTPQPSARTPGRLRSPRERPSPDSDEMDSDEGNGELAALFEALKSLLAQIDERLVRQATIDALDRRVLGNPLGGSGDAQCSSGTRPSCRPT
jgi:hypothetical protein